MSDPRFARLRTDPRFRKPKRHSQKVLVDERFKDDFGDKNGAKKKSKGTDFTSALAVHLSHRPQVATLIDPHMPPIFPLALS